MMKPLYDPEEKNISDIPDPEPFRWTDLEVERVAPAFYAAEDELSPLDQTVNVIPVSYTHRLHLSHEG